MLAKFDAKKLKALRKERKLTQECLAERADLSDRELREIERGGSKDPHFSTACRLSLALDVPMEALMDVSGEIGGDSIS